MKKVTSVLLIFIMLFVLLPQVVNANSPGPNLDGTVDTSAAEIVSLVVIYVFVYVLIVGFTCFIEWLVSIPFGMHKECAKIILVTNVLTQIGMHLLEIGYLAVTAVPAAFWLAFPAFIVILEIIVYATEFFIYYKKMLGFPTWSIILYTICANSASLLLGLLIIF